MEQVGSEQERDPAIRELDYVEHASKRKETTFKRIAYKIEWVGIPDRMKSIRKRSECVYVYYVK